jgi:hypothetical protein
VYSLCNAQGQWRMLVPFNVMASLGYPFVLQLDDDLLVTQPLNVRSVFLTAPVCYNIQGAGRPESDICSTTVLVQQAKT